MDLETIITALVGGITSIGTYFIGLRKNKAEVDSLVLENVKGILEIQTQTIEGLKKEIDELKKKIDGYENYIDELKSQIRQMRADMNKK